MSKTKANNSNQLTKKYNLQMTAKVGNDVINFTSEDAEIYFQLKEQAKIGMVETCKILVKVNERKLYLMEGYESMKDFVADVLSISYRTAENYMSLETNFGSLGINYAKLPATKLFEIAKDEEKMKKLSSPKTKDKEGTLLGYIEELKLRDKLNKQKKADAKSEGQTTTNAPELPISVRTDEMRRVILSYQQLVMKPDFPWEDDDAINEIGKVKEDLDRMKKAIPDMYLANIERVRDARRPAEDEEAARLLAEEEANRRMALPKNSEIKDAEISESEESNESEESDSEESDEVEDNG